ncbi:MAG: carboxylesterase/lipase family protein, partial [Clostridia bacterium]|nr:carboxylesterase/lipase family protein [Clostridia bacterium]
FYNGKTPIQTEWETEVASYYPQGEDCLYLNIWTSADRTVDGKAVMVFFHGGSYGWGGTADPLYDGFNFVSAHPEIVLVTVGYRTGIAGFVDFSSVPGGDAFPDAPNLGLLDQIESLRWIQRNISAFGGDPGLVTVFGESAGGGSVSLLPVIAEARGLFRRVIAQSGSVALTNSKEECRLFTKKLLKESRCSTMEELTALSEEELKKVNEKINAFNCFPQRDGRIIPLDPYLPYETGETASVDMLVGTNANEMNYWIGEIGGLLPYRLGMTVKYENDLRRLNAKDQFRAKEFIRGTWKTNRWVITEFYNELMFRLPAVRQMEGHAKNGGKAFMYYWSEQSSIPKRGACHAVELAYVFRNTDQTIYTGTPADRDLSDFTADVWARFARTGDPSSPEADWPPYDAEQRQTMIMSRNRRLESGILDRQRAILFPLLKYKLNPGYADLNFNVPFVRGLIAAGLLLLALIVTVVILLAT